MSLSLQLREPSCPTRPQVCPLGELWLWPADLRPRLLLGVSRRHALPVPRRLSALTASRPSSGLAEAFVPQTSSPRAGSAPSPSCVAPQGPLQCSSVSPKPQQACLPDLQKRPLISDFVLVPCSPTQESPFHACGCGRGPHTVRPAVDPLPPLGPSCPRLRLAGCHCPGDSRPAAALPCAPCVLLRLTADVPRVRPSWASVACPVALGIAPILVGCWMHRPQHRG